MARTARCPACGAPVVFRSVASVLAVCDFCRSTLVVEGKDLKNLGRMAEFLADRSPWQVGSAGRWRGRHFSLIGRLQLVYDAGSWDEWHLLFDDGKSGWLSEAGGELVVSEPRRVDEVLPAFAQLVVGESITLAGTPFQVSNVLKAECVAGSGELPFRVGSGYPAPVVDLRDAEGRFATLDYSDAADGRPPLVFIGEPVELTALSPVNLRDASAAAGATVNVRNFQCPNCGAPLSARSAQIQTVGCGSCGALVDPTDEVARRIATLTATQKVVPLIELGARGRLRGETLELIGFMQRRMNADGVDYFWREYVLVAADGSLRWLTEYDGHWTLARVLSQAVAALGATARVGRETYAHFQGYEARVDYVVGEFPWRVVADEAAKVDDYVAPPRLLSREATAGELSWTLADYLEPGEIAAAFGLKTALPAPKGVFANQPNPRADAHRTTCRTFWSLFVGAWVVHLALLLVGGGELLRENVVYRADDDEPRLSREFSLPDGAARLEVAHEVNLSNSWIALHLTLVNKTTGESWQFSRELAYYHGVDGGESWSEGRRDDELVFTDLSPGTYFLAEEAELDAAQATVAGQLRVGRAGPRWSSLLLLVVLLALPPLVSAVRQRAFEVARWAESDHPLVSASSGDASGDADGD